LRWGSCARKYTEWHEAHGPARGGEVGGGTEGTEGRTEEKGEKRGEKGEGKRELERLVALTGGGGRGGFFHFSQSTEHMAYGICVYLNVEQRCAPSATPSARSTALNRTERHE